MKDQLKLLEDLQRHDAKLKELEAAKNGIPEKLESMRKDLAKIEDMLARERKELEESEKWRKEKDDELKSQEQLLTKSKAKLAQVKNSKEYMATQREAETLRKLSTETQEKMGSLIDASDKYRTRIEAHQADVEKLRQLVEREAASSDAKIAVIEADAVKIRVEREAEAKAIRPDVLKRYNAIKMKRGLAVVAVHNGTCRGCNMNIPPQLYNTLQRGNSIELCPTCNRIVYWDKLFADPDGAPTEVAEAPEKPEKPAKPKKAGKKEKTSENEV